MTTFSFDNIENIINENIAAAKSINTNFCNDRNKCGLWISDANLLKINWKKCCTNSCEETCVEHFVNTKHHEVKTSNLDSEQNNIYISGRGIQNPRLIILRRSKMLKYNSQNKFIGVWRKGDGDIKENGERKYFPQMKYLLIFLDENNYPLHDDFVQLSTKGTFMVNFDKIVQDHRKASLSAYSKVNKVQGEKAVEQWHTMWILVPNFKKIIVESSYKRGPNGKPLTNDACSIDSFLVPDSNNWEEFCIGRNQELNKLITSAFQKTEKWNNKFFLFVSPPQREETFDFDNYEINELQDEFSELNFKDNEELNPVSYKVKKHS